MTALDAAWEAYLPRAAVLDVTPCRAAFDAGWKDARAMIREYLLAGDPGRLEAAFREFTDDEGAADCALAVRDLLAGDET